MDEFRLDHYVYLDYAASAPIRKEALAAENDYDRAPFAGANPNSLHTAGRQAARALDGARAVIARCLGGGFRPADITFTSGGTESNNLALAGLAEGMRARDRRRTRVAISAIEHDSVLDMVPQLRARGFEVITLPVGRDGQVRLAGLADVADSSLALVSVMSANNETGVIQPYEELAQMAHGVGAIMHTDAVQAFGRVALNLGDVDAVSIAAHKIGGPVGIGALALRGRTPLRPQSFGGGQEGGRRAGTQDVRGALAFAAAAQACCADMGVAGERTLAAAHDLIRRLSSADVGITTTVAEGVARLPGIVSLLVSGVSSDAMVLELDQAGYAVSAGSACSAGAAEPSHVLMAMGISGTDASGALRVSFDASIEGSTLERFADALIAVVAKHR